MSSLAGAPAPLTPIAFIKKWKRASLNERQSAQEHFIDLCALVGHPTPSDDDPTGERFAFEKGAAKVGGGKGFADVWMRDHFAWEYKRKNGNLDDALHQLIRYAPALESPPLHIVCDIDRIEIHTAWTNTVPAKYEISIDDIADAKQREILRNVFHDPEKLKPTKTRAAVTAEAADKFSTIALRLQGRGSAEDVAHFVNQLVFCFFATSVKLLPDGLLAKLLRKASQKPEKATIYFNKLFEAMETGGEFDLNDIAWFNGGLFDGRRAIRLDEGDLGLLIAAGSLDWSLIDPSIFGTLFERFLDPDKRAQIGAHYTDQEKITRIIEPVILRPLRAEWEAAKTEIESFLSRDRQPPMRAKQRRRMTPHEAAEEVRSRYLERLRTLQILDPACGSGNFLYLALQGVKDIENRANLECELLGLPPRLPIVGPEILRGIEINPLAAELARTTIWIGDIQWRIRNGIHARPIPILRKLDSIECRDALVASNNDQGSNLFERKGADFTEANWPEAEFIIGNPPFLGVRRMRTHLGQRTTESIFSAYSGRVSREADLVCYWFEKALQALNDGTAQRVGFVATNSIRSGSNRTVLDKIVLNSRIFDAWSDEPWVIDGAAVRVSLVCFGHDNESARLDGHIAPRIKADLTTGDLDFTRIQRISENLGIAYMGDTKGGKFDIPGDLAREWLRAPLNVNGKPNSEVVRPWRNGTDITRRSRDMWIVDFGCTMSEREASAYDEPFQYVKEHVLPERTSNRRESYKKNWWRHVEPRPAFIAAVQGHKRYLATSRVAKHRIFVWLDSQIVPDSRLFGFVRSDDTFFGIVQSRFHEAWTLMTCSWHGVGNDPTYNSAGVFETFAFPDGITPDLPAVRYSELPKALCIAQAAKRLDDLRNAWLNPVDLVCIEPEVTPGFPDRLLPKDTRSAALLRERTLTNLYNKRPQWLADAHRDLDAAVAAAYGWDADISEQDALAKLLALNLSRAAQSNERSKLQGGTAKPPRSRSPDEIRRSPEFTLGIDGGQASPKHRSAAKEFQKEGVAATGKRSSRLKRSA